MITRMCLKNKIKCLWSMIFNRPLVVLVDHDGEKSVRLGEYTENGFFAYRFSFTRIRLMPKGETQGASYVLRWYYGENIC
jgi:hypothetical protein